MKFDDVDEAVKAIEDGRPVLLVDDTGSKSCCYLLQNARDISPDDVNFMALHGKGIICAGVSAKASARLGLKPMPGAQNNGALRGSTISVEAKVGVSTGISTADRAETLQVLGRENAGPEDWVSPGHIFPVSVKPDGILREARPAEAVVELVRLAGGGEAGVFCAVLDESGERLAGDRADEFAAQHALAVVRTSRLRKHRLLKEFIVRRVGARDVSTQFGEFHLLLFENELDHSVHPVFVRGDLAESEAPLARIHSQCLTGDAFHSLRCDCGDQLEASMRAMNEEGCGVLVYLRQEGRGIGLTNKVKAYRLQDQGKDTVDANLALGFEADERSYVLAAQIFKNLGIENVRLITNNARKIQETQDWGIGVSERVAMDVAFRPENALYLKTKRDRLGHLLKLED